MVRMNITPIAGHRHKYEAGGFASTSMCGLARKLKAAGFPDQPFECFRGDQRSLVGKSLYWAADRMVSEGPDERVRYVKFKAVPQKEASGKRPRNILAQKSESPNATAPAG